MGEGKEKRQRLGRKGTCQPQILAACCACKESQLFPCWWPDPRSGRTRPDSSEGRSAGKPLGDSTLAHRRGMGGKGTHSNTWEARTGRVCRQGSSNMQLAFSAQRSLLSPRMPFPPVQARQTPSQTHMLRYYKILFSLRTI